MPSIKEDDRIARDDPEQRRDGSAGIDGNGQDVPETAEEGRQDEEDAALLTGQRTNKKDQPHSRIPFFPANQRQRQKLREIILFTWAFLASAAVIVLGALWQHSHSPPPSTPKHQTSAPKQPTPPQGKHNLIFMVSDGMGPSSLSLTRSWLETTREQQDLASELHSPNDEDPFQKYTSPLLLDTLQIGHSRTRSTNSLITDSAAGATAFSCGAKSYNGAISVIGNSSRGEIGPCGSVMEAAHRAGYATGIVVTTSVTDATPAVFVSHVRRREMQDEIAAQMVGGEGLLGEGERVVDLVFGGGRCHFLPRRDPSNDEAWEKHGCRNDGRDMLKTAAEQGGWKVISNRTELDTLQPSYHEEEDNLFPLLGLFASHDFPYEIDRRHEPPHSSHPSLEAMTRKALTLLSSATEQSEKGFFLMIEGSRIDHAGHGNDPAAQVHEVAAYDAAVRAVMDFIQDDSSNNEVPTLMISTSDHETGGLAVGRQVNPRVYPHYAWFPEVLANVSRSASFAGHAWREYWYSSSSSDDSPREIIAHLRSLLETHLGISDPADREISEIFANPLRSSYLFAEMVSRRAEIGWATHGHTAADVAVFASSPLELDVLGVLGGGRENVEVGGFLRWWLGVGEEVEGVTRELRERWRDLEKGDGDDGQGSIEEDACSENYYYEDL